MNNLNDLQVSILSQLSLFLDRDFMFDNVSFDCDNNDGELIFTFKNVDFIIRSRDIHEFVD